MRRWVSLFCLLFVSSLSFAQIQNPPTKWNAIRPPNANFSISVGNYTSQWTAGNATGATNLFSITDLSTNIAATGALLKIAPGTRANATDLNPIPLVLQGGHNFQGTLPVLRMLNGPGTGMFDLRTHDVLGGFTATIATNGEFRIYNSVASLVDANLRMRVGAPGYGTVSFYSYEDTTSPSATVGGLSGTNAFGPSFTQANTAAYANYVYFGLRSSTTDIISISVNGFATHTGGYSVFLPNAGATGTLLNGVAKLSGGTLVRTATTDTTGAVGITVMAAGTTGSAKLLISGLAYCVFEGATTAGNYVQISAATAGNCKDAGATYPATGQVLGRVLSTNGAAGTYQMLVRLER